MKKLISAAMAVLLLAGCANNAAVTSETAAETTTATTAAVTTTTTTAETTTETTAAELAAVTARVPEMSDECRALYAAVIADIAGSEDYIPSMAMFDLYDMDSDGVPELFVSLNPAHGFGVDIYTVSNGEAVRIGGKLGAWGTVQVHGNSLISRYGTEYELYEKKGNELSRLAKLEYTVQIEHKETDVVTEEYRVNDEIVSEEEYVEEWAKYSSSDDDWTDVGRRYYFHKDTVKEIFGCAVMPEMSGDYKDMYSVFLSWLLENELSEARMPMFDLYDFDGDDIPELFVSADDSHSDGVDIYTVSGEEVIKLVKGSGSWGETLVSGKYLRGGFSNMGASIDKIYEKNGLQLVQLVTLESAEMWNTAGENEEVPVIYRINDENVSEEEYNAEWEKYPDEWKSVGRRYWLDKETAERFFGQ